jgi:hypothetical protein
MAEVRVVSRRPNKAGRRITRPLRVLLLVITLWPAVYMGIFLVIWFRLLLNILSPAPGTSPSFPIALFAAHLATMLISMGLIAFYIVHLFRNDRVESNMKAIWAIVLFMGSFIAMPVYWYLYIWQDAGTGGTRKGRDE